LKNNLVLYPDKENLLEDYCNIFFEERILYELDSKILKKNKHIVEKPILYNNNQRLDSFEKCEKIFNLIMDDIYIILNKTHQVNWKKKSWEILIGHWLKKFIYIVFFKYQNIKNIFNKYEISNVFLSSSDNNEVATHETWEIYNLSIDKEWSWILSSKIIENIDNSKLTFDKSTTIKKNFYEKKTFYERTHDNLSIKSKLLKKLSHMVNFFFNNNNNLITNTYLPIIEEKKLEILFNQIPRVYSTPKINYEPINHNLRKNIKITKDDFCIESKIIRDLITFYLPTFAVENFKNLKLAVDKNNYPLNPKFIYTSNLFEADEAFKYFVADNLSSSKPAKYIVGQHGNSYFTRIDNNFANEITSCDYFLSWGDKNAGDKKIINLFNFKHLNNKKNEKQGRKLLIILRSLGYQAVPYDRWHEGNKEFDIIKKFILSIKNDFKDDIIIRLHQTFNYRYKFFVKKFLNGLEDFKIDFGYNKIENLAIDSKIIIFNYDSTGFLESLISNKPSICFYPNIFNHLNYDCVKYYQLLKDSKIIFDDETELRIHLESIWEDPMTWWNSKKVEDARNTFSKMFSKPQNNNPLKSIKEKIIEKLN
jgi:putative transferase (TIGR04331 family)